MMKRTIVIALSAVCLLLTAHLNTSNIIPLNHEAIAYVRTPAKDVVAQLNEKLAAKKTALSFEEGRGFLDSVLKALNMPVESQTLVFTKTSFQSPRIAPRTPRALYFNEDVSVGWVRGGDVLEVAAVDPKQGVIFYTLEQDPVARPRFVRQQDNCLQCHATAATSGIPGLMLRSVHSDGAGQPLLQVPSFLTTHELPLEKRWGGWFVTGNHGSQIHKGNALALDRSAPGELSTDETRNLVNLKRKFDTGAYPTPYSDIVALMVFEHQSQAINLMIRLGFETRIALHEQAAAEGAKPGVAPALNEAMEKRLSPAVESLLGYLLFAKEAPLTDKVVGGSGFAELFSKAGRRDKLGRSLRDFDLSKRMFRFPCSYTIYSAAFDGMPNAAKDLLYRRLWDVLTGADASPAYSHLTSQDKEAILSILKGTKTGLPAYWQAT